MSSPPGRVERLESAASALGFALDPATVDRLLRFIEMLHRWNATYNLTAVRDPDDMLNQHVVDCLAAVAALQRRFGSEARRVLDVGSGGGLPGVVIAAVRCQDRVVCVDTVGKKAAFVRQVAGELGLPNLVAEHARVESLRLSPFDVITARAFASLPELVRLTAHHLASGGVWMAMKGKRPDDEIAGLPDTVEVFHVEHLTLPSLRADRCLVWIRAKEGAR